MTSPDEGFLVHRAVQDQSDGLDVPGRSRTKRVYAPRDHDTGNPRRSFRLRPGSALERAIGDRPISDALHYMAARLEALGEKVPQL